ncbi:hypothetical protein [uncultured Kordia sp.]|uniref:hypothetical protein n=1 Tax=uncultured Kordia sp. TaxID=507699 RepID=UPI00262094BD|nr:hypothetical protein [uncultured Kordia sp.]
MRSLLLLAIFVLLKMGVAHSMSHAFSHDDVAECEDCFLILDSNEKNLFDSHTDTFEETTLLVETLHKPIILLYKNPVVTEFYTTQFFNRPPPALV